MEPSRLDRGLASTNFSQIKIGLYEEDENVMGADLESENAKVVVPPRSCSVVDGLKRTTSSL